jgi:hypothetical protein
MVPQESTRRLFLSMWAYWGCGTTSGQPTIRWPKRKNLDNPSTMASETHLSFKLSSMTTCLPCPTIQHGNPIFRPSCHGPRIRRRHSRYNPRPESPSSSRHNPRIRRRHVVARESLCVFFPPSFTIDLQFGCHRITAPRICLFRPSRSSSRHNPRIRRRHVVARESLCKMYTQVMYITFDFFWFFIYIK